MTLTTRNLSFFHHPSNVGFDRWIDIPQLLSEERIKTTFPPHNLIKVGEFEYIIELAVAGYKQSDLDITQEKSQLVIKGDIKEKEQTTEYIHKGLAGRNFTKSFTLADTIIVQSASLEDGILKVFLKNQIPERDKPRKIEIGTSAPDVQLLVE